MTVRQSRYPEVSSSILLEGILFASRGVSKVYSPAGVDEVELLGFLFFTFDHVNCVTWILQEMLHFFHLSNCFAHSPS